MLGPSNWVDGSGTHTLEYRQAILGANTNPVRMPLPLQIGDVITSWRTRVQKNTGGGATLTARLLRITNGTATTIETLTESGLGVGNTSIVSGDVEYLVVGGSSWAVEITPGNSASPGADRLFAVELSRCRPDWRAIIDADGPVS
ncbi:MAG: hypothetical protein KF773_26800 [Deltaproteobacteria bacterium]|nr:hypothetical protein [Deltaproteobacteria bacterium]